jgi:DNA-binding transcriptional ArsR family regulator
MTAITSIEDPRYVKAMSHPLRVRIMAMLEERPASPVELARWLDASLGTVAYHVRTLERLGLIELEQETRVRGAIRHHYRARPRPTVSDEAWEQAQPITRQVAIGSSMQLINEQVRMSAAAGGFDRPETHLARTRLRLDREGWREAARAYRELLEHLERIERDALERIARDPHAEGIVDAGVVTMLFEAANLSGPVDPRQPADRRAEHAPETP